MKRVFSGKLAEIQPIEELWEDVCDMKITLLNTSILTAYGVFEFQPVTISEAREMVKKAEIVSAIGHAATAAILSDLLGIDNRQDKTFDLSGWLGNIEFQNDDFSEFLPFITACELLNIGSASSLGFGKYEVIF